MASSDDNPIAALPEYYLRNLVAHLEAAGRYEELHRLLALETSQERNAWFEAKEAIADTQGYLDDIVRAWRLAEAARDMPKQIHYALCRSSVMSTMVNLSPQLVLLSVQHGYMSSRQALMSVQFMADEAMRTEALLALLDHLPEQLRITALAIAQSVAQAELRVRALAGLMAHLSGASKEEALRDALSTSYFIEDADHQIEALISLAPYLSQSPQRQVFREIMTTARSIDSRAARHDSSRQASALVALAPHLGEGVLQDARKAACAIRHQKTRVRALVGIASCLPQAQQEAVLREALALARGIEDYADRACALTYVARELSRAERMEVLEDALAAAGSICDGARKEKAITALIPHMCGIAHEQMLQDTMAHVLAIAAVTKRTEALIGLIPCLPEPLLHQAVHAAVSTARTIVQDSVRSKMLVCLVPHLSNSSKAQVLEEALATARSIRWDARRVEALVDMAPYLPEASQGQVFREALATAREIEERSIYEGIYMAGLGTNYLTWDIGPPDVIAALAPHLHVGVVHSALDAIKHETQTQYDLTPLREEILLNALSYLGPSIPTSLRSQAIETARSFRHNRSKALTTLIPHLPESMRRRVLREALAVSQAVEDEAALVDALLELVGWLPKDTQGEALQDALRAARSIRDEWQRAVALTRLSPHLPPSLSSGVLGMASQIGRPGRRAEALFHQALKIAETESNAAVKADAGEGLLARALRDALTSGACQTSPMDDDEDVAHLVLRLVSWAQSQPSPACSTWKRVLRKISDRSRQEYLHSLLRLMPYSLALVEDEEKLAVSIFRSMQAAMRWWP